MTCSGECGSETREASSCAVPPFPGKQRHSWPDWRQAGSAVCIGAGGHAWEASAAWELSSEAMPGSRSSLALLIVPPARSLFNAFVNLESFLLLA